ncbi:MAG: glycosyltransferase family 9 protein [Alphaproteobacteria bacterium]
MDPAARREPEAQAAKPRILVIKLGALGDFIQALGPMKAIRDHHGQARITLLTTAPFKELAEASGHFDEVCLDGRPSLFSVPGWLALAWRLRAGRFDRVYDLQTSGRSSAYFHLVRRPLAGGPEWSGIARGCSHPDDDPRRNALHTVDRQAAQLSRAGIARVPATDVAFLEADVDRFGLAPPYALLVPGGAPHRPGKRWPADSYADLARRLVARGVTPVVLGANAEGPVAARIHEICAGARDLTGATTLAEVAALARGAVAAVGNDTGPMHILAAAGCPCLVLFSHDSDPALCAPRGDKVTVIRRRRLADLGVDEVEAALEPRRGAAA